MLSEQYIQKKIIDQKTKEGYYVLKLIKTNLNGIPDLLCLKPDEPALFIEVKKEKGGVISKLQMFRIDQLRELGFTAYVTNNKEKLY